VEAIPTGQGFDSDIRLAGEAHPEAPAWMDPGTLDADLAFDGTTDSVEATGATYGEAGLVAVNAHDDGAFAAVDGEVGHCVAGATHNQPDDAGLVGCRTALPAAVPLGRFTPQEFALVEQRIVDRLARAEAGCVPTPTGFTYLGETLATEMILEARNAAGAVTRHYRGAYASLGPADTADWSAIHDPGGAGRESLTDRLVRDPGTTLEGWGEGDLGRLSLRIPLTVDRAADPEGPWTDVRFGFTAADADSIALVADGLDASGDGTPDRALAGATELRHGRLALASDHAAEFADLTLGIASEYWVSAAEDFRTSTEDDCTPLRDAGGSRLRYRSAPAGEAFGSWGEEPTLGETSATVEPAATLGAGEAALDLTAPGEAGRVEVCLDLTDLDYLHYAWTEPADGLPAGCAGSPVGRAIFGVSHQGSDDVLFTREVFR
jgi:MSHA biogenesis protein MshQ